MEWPVDRARVGRSGTSGAAVGGCVSSRVCCAGRGVESAGVAPSGGPPSSSGHLLREHRSMDELILLELEGGATAEQREILLRWRRASEEHERRYQELRATWLLLGRRDEIDVGLQIPTVEGLFRHA